MKRNALSDGLVLHLYSGQQIYLVWLSYVYLALALRENVLIVNGSNIRSWWILHHYLSILACLIMLALPVDSPGNALNCAILDVEWS